MYLWRQKRKIRGMAGWEDIAGWCRGWCRRGVSRLSALLRRASRAFARARRVEC